MQSGLDTHFVHVRDRVQAKNPAREFVGVVDSLDWPTSQVRMEAFYLLTLPGTTPVNEGWSESNPTYTSVLQWIWMIAGADLASGEQGANRGDRGRLNRQMKEELINGLYPGFAQKKSYGVGEGPQGEPLTIVTASDPFDVVRWRRGAMLDKVDKASGLIYGAATIYLTDIESTITS